MIYLLLDAEGRAVRAYRHESRARAEANGGDIRTLDLVQGETAEQDALLLDIACQWQRAMADFGLNQALKAIRER